MTMRVLIIDDAAKADIASVAQYAQEFPYRPGPHAPVPGSNPNHTVQIGDYRFVFTITHAEGLIFRHLTASIPGDKYPNPVAVFTVAALFGFTGWTEAMGARMPADWIGDTDTKEHCVALAQPMRMDLPFKMRN